MAPLTGGETGSFANYAREAELRNRVANLEQIERTSGLVPRMDPVAREVCTASGNGRLVDTEGAAGSSQVLHDYFALEATHSIRQEFVRPQQCKRASQTVDEYLVRFDLPRRKPGARAQAGGLYPGTSVSVLCLHTVSPSRPAILEAPAGARGDLGMALVARRVRRLVGRLGGPVRQT